VRSFRVARADADDPHALDLAGGLDHRPLRDTAGTQDPDPQL
jgi:hypothetical protein